MKIVLSVCIIGAVEMIVKFKRVFKSRLSFEILSFALHDPAELISRNNYFLR
ncbi:MULTISPECIES: hypothetical protein [Methanobacterium]|uniref:hypothetical protein n=1 Tax=Methanobacterium TaxID=2160 RepID=UPI0015B3A4E3|nr:MULTISPECIES: hypothetical protein [Methanobacterium]